MYQTLARAYDPNFEPLLRVGEHVIPYMPGHPSKMRSQDRVAPIYVITNHTPITPFTVDLAPSAAIDAAGATQGASKVGTKIDLSAMLKAPDNVLYQFRFHPLADFRVRLYQPLQVAQYNAQLNGTVGGVGWSASLDPRGNPQNEFFQYSDGSLGMEAVNDHRIALQTAPVRLWGHAYRMAEKSVEQILLEKTAQDAAAGNFYTGVYRNAIAELRDQKKAADRLITTMLRDRAIKAFITPPESTF